MAKNSELETKSECCGAEAYYDRFDDEWFCGYCLEECDFYRESYLKKRVREIKQKVYNLFK